MKNILRITAVAIACSYAATAFAATPTDISAAKRGSAFASKKAQCKREAKAKHFGVHVVERNRWVKDCIAGSRT
jgi:hypothetical protein